MTGRLPLATALLWVALAAGLAAQSPPDRGGQGFWTVRFTDRPSLRGGSVVRLDLTTTLQGDLWRTADEVDAETASLRRRRIGVKGTMLKRVSFEIEHELREHEAWRDVQVDVRASGLLRFRVGRFKMPFSLDETTSVAKLDFIHRSRMADTLAPGRSTGVTAHGQTGGRAFAYDIGVFARDGDNARFNDNPGAGRTVAGRVELSPRRGRVLHGTLTVGGNATVGRVAAGKHSLRGRMVSSDTFFTSATVDGRRLRLGADVEFRSGRLTARGEAIRVSDQRRDVAAGRPLVASAGYVGGAWAVFGKPLEQAGGRSSRLRSLKLTGRVERVRFDSRSAPESAGAAASGRIGSALVFTTGANWEPVRWTRVQFNVIREQLGDQARSPVDGRLVFWSTALRFQFAM